jgi:hypothetical protein
MPRPICVKCNREMIWEKPVTVQFNARSVNGAYQQWQGDLAHCPDCGAEFVARFGEQPSWEHHRKDETPGTPDIVVEELRK